MRCGECSNEARVQSAGLVHMDDSKSIEKNAAITENVIKNQ